MRRKKFFVGGHKARLANRRARLSFGEFARAFLIAQRAHARADRPGSHDDDFSAGGALLGDLRRQLLHLAKVGLLPAIRQDAGSQLDHDSVGLFEQFAAHNLFGNK